MKLLLIIGLMIAGLTMCDPYRPFFILPPQALAETQPLKKQHTKKPRKKQIILMEKGESKVLFSPLSETVWLSRPGIVSIRETGASHINLQAKQEGEVLLNIGTRLYLIQVLSREKKQQLTVINDFLNNRMGLTSGLVEDQIHIQGTLYRVKDFIDLSQISQEQNIPYLFKAKAPADLRPALQEYIYRQISGLPQPLLLWEKPLTILVPEDKSLKSQYQAQLKHLGVAVRTDPSLLPTPPLVKLKVLLMETNGDHSFQTHIDYGENTITQLLDGSLFKQMFSTFKTMENKGTAQILSQAVLLNESGKKSYFHSGGSAPIPHFNPETGTQGIQWKPYGVQLSFETRADRSNKIHISTQVEISEINHSHSTQSAPALKNNSIHSSVTMRSGQSLLLSKLIRRQKGVSRRAPMEIFRLPLAGSLLSFKGKIKEHTRLHIFITAFLLRFQKGKTP